MQNEQGIKPDHQVLPERLWVFRTGGPEALWVFLAWLNRYGHQIRLLAGEIHSRTVDSTVTAIGTTVFVRFYLRGPRPMDTWPSDVLRRWQQLEASVIPWVEEQASVACIQPAVRRQVESRRDVDKVDLEDGGKDEAAPTSVRSAGDDFATERGRGEVSPTHEARWGAGRSYALGQTPASRLPRQAGDGGLRSRAVEFLTAHPERPLVGLDGAADGETGEGSRPTRCRRRCRRVAHRFAWRGHCGANRICCRRRVGFRPGLGCR